MKIRKNGKTINLTQTEAKKIINRYNIDKFLNENKEGSGPFPLPPGKKGSVSTIVDYLETHLLKKYGEPGILDDGELNKIFNPIKDRIYDAIKKIESAVKDDDTEKRVKRIKE